MKRIKHALEVNQWRGRLFALAMANFVRNYQDRLLFDQINEAYEETPPDPAEQALMRQLRQQHRRMVEGEW
ncbi:MAG: hypothetical protein AB1791_12205 [Chloroflexota bacterium]